MEDAAAVGLGHHGQHSRVGLHPLHPVQVVALRQVIGTAGPAQLDIHLLQIGLDLPDGVKLPQKLRVSRQLVPALLDLPHHLIPLVLDLHAVPSSIVSSLYKG